MFAVFFFVLAILIVFFFLFVLPVLKLDDPKNKLFEDTYSKKIVASVDSQNTFPDIGKVLEWLKKNELESDYGASLK